MTHEALHPGTVVSGPLLPEPVEILTIGSLGDSMKLTGRGLKTGLVHCPILTPAQLAETCLLDEQRA